MKILNVLLIIKTFPPALVVSFNIFDTYFYNITFLDSFILMIMLFFSIALIITALRGIVLCEDRCLHIMHCDNRADFSLRAYKSLIVPAMRSNVDKLHLTHFNPCIGKPFGTSHPSDVGQLFLKKPYFGLKYLRENASFLCREEFNYLLVVDSDVFWCVVVFGDT